RREQALGLHKHPMRRAGHAFFFWILLSCTACGGRPTRECAVRSIPGATESADARAQAVLSQLSRDEKLQMGHGAAPSDWGRHKLPRGAQSWIPSPRCSAIPDLYFADGSVGVRDSVGPATALPSSIASAASWDLDEAAKYGHVIGVESRAYGIN